MNNAINKINAVVPPGITGAGIGIAILDTGICPLEDFTLPRNRIIAFKDFVYGRNNVYDDNGHGTHINGCKSKRIYEYSSYKKVIFSYFKIYISIYTFQCIVTSFVSSRVSISM